MKKIFISIIGWIAIFGFSYANPETRERFGREAKKHPDITTLEAKPYSLGAGNPRFNSILTSKEFDGSKKYPVVLIFPPCGGAWNAHAGGPNQMKLWAQAAIQRGYLAFVVDSLAARGADQNCVPRPIEDGRLLKDGVDAAEFLSTLPFIEGKQIYAVGFSLGGQTSMLLTSPLSIHEVKKSEFRVKAAASLYGGCQYWGGRHLYLQDDPDQRPLLLLMGSKDTEAPPEDCDVFVEFYKKKGRPIAAHIYPGISHAWDVPELSGFSKMANSRRWVTYQYSKETTIDSLNKVFQFFEANK